MRANVDSLIASIVVLFNDLSEEAAEDLKEVPAIFFSTHNASGVFMPWIRIQHIRTRADDYSRSR